jgi:hypothetical protein
MLRERDHVLPFGTVFEKDVVVILLDVTIHS